MTCREFADFIADYLAGELPPETLARFEGHLSQCANCGRYLAGYEATVKLGRHAFDDPQADVPADVPEELVQAILQSRLQDG